MTDKYSLPNTKNKRNNAEEMEVGQGSDMDHMPAPAGTRREAERGEVERAPSGPACSKTRCGTRSRSGSVSSVSSCTSSASTAMTAERKSRREVAHEANRLAVAVAKEQGGEEQPPIYVDSDESEEGSRSSDRREHPLKRKMADVEDSGELSEETRRKQGRPQTTGLYVKRAEAFEELNKKKRESAKLDEQKVIRSMSTGQVFSKVERDLEEAVEEMENTPTADVAQQARKCMAEVLKVAKGSKNLQGGYVRILKHAAVVGAATAEVLRTRADSSESDSNAFRQLDSVKREAQAAREEAE